jgi:4-amino-4-deoxy-L-arabinose transferase-like glycosyltransferase
MPAATALPPRSVLWALAAAIVLLWFVNLDARRLAHPDEGRYAEIAREMVVTGDWVTPRLNDLKYFEKPPFQYWMTAAAFRVGGINEAMARLWPALAGLLAVAAIGYAGFALGGPALGAFAGLALAGTLWHAGIAQIVTLDSGLAFFLTLALAALLVAQRDETPPPARRAWMWVVYAAMAGATLSKGLIGIVLPGGALVAYSLVTRDFALWRRLHLVSGLALCLALSAPWFVAVARVNPEFLRFFFIHEHFERYLTTGHRRTGALWYFVPILVVGVLPWLAVLATGTRRAWREGTANALGFSWPRFCLVYAAVIFLFFSASSSKLPAYILPLFAPLALVAAWLLLRLDAQRLARYALAGAVATGALAVAVIAGYDGFVPRFADDRQPLAVLQAFGPWLKGGLLLATVGGLAAWRAFAVASRVPTGRFWGVALLALSTLGFLQVEIRGFDAFSTTRSAWDILRAAQAGGALAANVPFYQVEMYDQTVPFYLGRPTPLVEFRDELSLGLDAEPAKGFATTAAWTPQWTGLAQGYALMPPDRYAALAAAGVPMRVLARDGRRVLVSRQ